MDTMETRVRRRVQRGMIKTTILQIVAIGGIITLAVAAPNVTKLISRRALKRLFERPPSTRAVAVSKLISQGCLVREDVHGKNVLRITDKGRSYLAREERKYMLGTPPRWDHKWRVIIFDIKEKYRATRTRIRQELRAVGFVMLQGSVWVYPYPCEDFVALLKADARVGKAVLYMVVEEIENDKWLREHFGIGKT